MTFLSDTLTLSGLIAAATLKPDCTVLVEEEGQIKE
jgi:hypothetical protein